MILYPNCKINVGLRVVRKREDGYHDLETIFYPIMGLHDELEIDASKAFSFVQEGIVVDCPAESNLIVRCYRQMREHYPAIGDVHIRFRKHIPFGAGLGGGSSDAAHTAIALNEIFQLGLSREQLANEVRTLGADCPFFIYNTPCFAEGIGDVLHPIDFSLSGLRIVMIKPDCGVSTREAYSGIHLEAEQNNERHSAMSSLYRDERWWEHACFANDFEQSVFPLHPEIGCIKQRLSEAGALFASMSGSGSTVFGLFENNAERGADTRFRTLHEEFASMILL
ncbi:MAG: 4-(cytidine 5'-diphospho)-2-C-methyl-D-erythritol kinase, partial [Paludibacteraceae bacterium]